MSTNCARCVTGYRDGTDLLCSECRAKYIKEEPESPMGAWSQMKDACKAARCYCQKLAGPAGVSKGPILQGAARVYEICNIALESAERAEKNLPQEITEDAE